MRPPPPYPRGNALGKTGELPVRSMPDRTEHRRDSPGPTLGPSTSSVVQIEPTPHPSHHDRPQNTGPDGQYASADGVMHDTEDSDGHLHLHCRRYRKLFKRKNPNLAGMVYGAGQKYVCTIDGCTPRGRKLEFTLKKLRKHWTIVHERWLADLPIEKQAMPRVEGEVNSWYKLNQPDGGTGEYKLDEDGNCEFVQVITVGDSSRTATTTHPAARSPGLHGIPGQTHILQPRPVPEIKRRMHKLNLGTTAQGRDLPYVSPYSTSAGHAGSSTQAAPHLPVRGIPAAEHSREWSRHTHRSSSPYVSPYADSSVGSTMPTGHAGSSILAAPHLPVRAIPPVEHLREWSRPTHRSSSPYASPYAGPVVESTTASTGHTDRASHLATGRQEGAGRENQGQESAGDRERENQTGSESGANPHGRPWGEIGRKS